VCVCVCVCVCVDGVGLLVIPLRWKMLHFEQRDIGPEGPLPNPFAKSAVTSHHSHFHPGGGMKICVCAHPIANE
jgi:hypothetical protein